MNLLQEYQSLLTSISAAQQEIEQGHQALLSVQDAERLVRSVARKAQGAHDEQDAAVAPPTTGEWTLSVPEMAVPFPLADAITIGRSESCDLTFDDGKVSRQHARIERRQESFWVVDLNSSNGVFVNEQRITEAVQLKSGDQLRIGDSIITVTGPTSSQVEVATIIDLEPISIQVPAQPGNQPQPAADMALVCQQCQQPLNPGVKFCRSCGTPITQSSPPQTPGEPTVKECTQCGNILSETARFCAKCGTTVT